MSTAMATQTAGIPAMQMDETELKPLRDLILVGNMLAMKVGNDELANTWDEMVIRLRESGLLEKLMMTELGKVQA